MLQERVKENPTFGLPLFKGEAAPQKKADLMLESAPHSIALATDTRKLAHIALNFDPKDLSRKQRVVLNAIREHGPVTNEEINKILGWQAINRVTGRTYELRSYGMEKRALVVPAGKRVCSVTGSVAATWIVNEAFFPPTEDGEAND
jgi:hypothetical protein